MCVVRRDTSKENRRSGELIQLFPRCLKCRAPHLKYMLVGPGNLRVCRELEQERKPHGVTLEVLQCSVKSTGYLQRPEHRVKSHDFRSLGQ